MRALALALVGLGCAPPEASPPIDVPPPAVCVGEFMASNHVSVVIGGDAPDWLELHNPGATPVALDGWTIDDGGDPAPFAAGEEVPAGAALLLVADGSAGRGHVPFKLSSGGETLTLRDPSGLTDVVAYPPMPSDFVRRRLAPCCTESGCWRLDPDATPGVL